MQIDLLCLSCHGSLIILTLSINMLAHTQTKSLWCLIACVYMLIALILFAIHHHNDVDGLLTTMNNNLWGTYRIGEIAIMPDILDFRQFCLVLTRHYAIALFLAHESIVSYRYYFCWFCLCNCFNLTRITIIMIDCTFVAVEFQRILIRNGVWWFAESFALFNNFKLIFNYFN
jgi:hypothetical protein